MDSPAIQQARVNTSDNRFRHAVTSPRLSWSEPHLDHARLIFAQQAYRFASELPHIGELADPIVPLESRIVGQHKNHRSISGSCSDSTSFGSDAIAREAS
jgi:hypothetical protein